MHPHTHTHTHTHTFTYYILYVCSSGYLFMNMSSQNPFTWRCWLICYLSLNLQALSVFRSAVFDLYTAPRLSEPVWLNMMCYTSQRVALYQNFLKEFMSVLDKYDTKNTKLWVFSFIHWQMKVCYVLLHQRMFRVPTVGPGHNPIKR